MAVTVRFRPTGWEPPVVQALSGTAAGSSADSATIAAPGAPTNLRLTTDPVEGTSVELAWDAPATGGMVTSYELLRDGVVIQSEISGTNTTDSSASPGEEYTYTVIAVGPGGVSDESDSLVVEVPEAEDTTAPATPTGFAQSGTITESSIPYVWDEHPDTDGDLDEIRVYYTTDGNDPTTDSNYQAFAADSTGGSLTGLPADTTVKAAAAAADDSGNISALSSVVSATTAEAEGGDVEPLFSDNFDSGDKTSANGFVWASGPDVSDDHSYSGSYSLWMPFGPQSPSGGSHWWSEQRYSHPSSQEVWFDFRFYIPSNFYHRRPNAANNNKLFAYWGPNGYSKPGMGMFQFWSSSAGTSSFVNYARYGPTSTYAEYRGGDHGFIDSSMLGQWHRLRIQIRLSDMGQNNGIARLWVGDDLLINLTGDNNNANTEQANVITDGYLLGWDNSGYDEQTDFYIDDFKLYTDDPGWL